MRFHRTRDLTLRSMSDGRWLHLFWLSTHSSRISIEDEPLWKTFNDNASLKGFEAICLPWHYLETRSEHKAQGISTHHKTISQTINTLCTILICLFLIDIITDEKYEKNAYKRCNTWSYWRMVYFSRKLIDIMNYIERMYL